MNLKNVKSHNQTKIIFSIILICSLLFTTGCENLLSGSDLKDELNKRIDYSNAPYAQITVTSEGAATAALIPAAGNYSDDYKAGDFFEVQFEPQSTFRFVKWISTPENAAEFEDEQSLTTKVTIKDTSAPIIIQPYTLLREKVIIHFFSEHGSTVPVEEKRLYLGDEFNLSFREESGYAFTGWKVIDELNGEEVSDVLEFSGNGEDVTVKVLDVNRKVTVRAETVARPKVVCTTPLYDSNGVYRDRRIIVMFDDDMEKSSIYYTKEELVKLKVLTEDEDLSISNSQSGYKLLKDLDQCYGYQKLNDDSTIVFKNISITNRKKTVNYLKYFLPPYFDANDSSVLRIDADLNNPPPSATDVLVTINKEMSTLINGSKIGLAIDYSWAYYTNGKVDKDNPYFGDFSVQFADDNQTTYKPGNTKIPDDIAYFNVDSDNPDYTNYKKVNLETKQLWVKGVFSDGGAGPASLKWSLKKINSPYYPVRTSNGEIDVLNGQIDSLDIVGANAEIKNDGVRIVLESEEVSYLAEGMYRIDFICSDKNELTETKSFYFIHDFTPPAKISDYHSGARNKAVEISFGTQNLYDVSQVKITGDGVADINVQENKTYKKRFDYSSNNVNHSFVLQTVDIVGNESTETVTINENSGVSTGMILYNPTNKTEDLFCSKNFYVKTPIGVVADASDSSKIRVWDLSKDTVQRYPGPWDRSAMPSEFGDIHGHKTEKNDGLITYNNIMECEYTKNNIVTTETKSDTYYIYAYLKNHKNMNSPVVWYLPSIGEADMLRRSTIKRAMKTGFDLLNENGLNYKLVYDVGLYIGNVLREDECYAAMVWNKDASGYIWYSYATDTTSSWESYGIDIITPTNYYIIYNRYMCQVDMR